jgi:hypothetical protein
MPGFIIADIKAEICNIEWDSPGSKGKEITSSRFFAGHSSHDTVLIALLPSSAKEFLRVHLVNTCRKVAEIGSTIPQAGNLTGVSRVALVVSTVGTRTGC